MSTDANADMRDHGDSPTIPDYDDMLATLDVAIEEAQRKVQQDRMS